MAHQPTILTRITAQVSFNGPVEVRVLAAQFSIDGKFVITGDVKGNIRLWHIEGVKQVPLGMALRVQGFQISGVDFGILIFQIEGFGEGVKRVFGSVPTPKP